MSRQSRISEALALLVAKLNDLNSRQGQLSQLSTTNKANLVAAINEAFVLASQPSGAQINDATTSETEVWSSSQTDSAITAALNAALEGQDLSEIADKLLALMQADQGLVSASANQTFTVDQKTQARGNIDAASATGVGDTDFDFAADIALNLTF